jgi:hypothetical protein
MKMINTMKRIAFVLTLGLLMTGCASTHMQVIPDDQRVTRPEQGKALIYFARPGSFGGAIQAPLYDGEKFIGVSSANTIVPYQADPGSHLFMVIGENADFLQAELLPGKTYYAQVTPRMGAWKARFSLRPQNGQIPDDEVAGWFKSCKQVKLNDSGLAWAEQNAASTKKMRDQDLPRWESKDNAEKQVLVAGSGK